MGTFRHLVLLITLSILISGCSTDQSTEEINSSHTPELGSQPSHMEESKPPPTESNVFERAEYPILVKNPEDALIRTIHKDSLVHLEWKPYGSDVNLPIKFGNDKVELIFGLDHPNGTKISILFPDQSFAWQLDMSMKDGSSTLDSGDLREGYKLQAAVYDFDDDGISELIIAAGDKLTNLNIWVFSYTHVDNIKKINPFRQELATSGQSIVYLDKNEILLPYGSQGLFDSYKYVDKNFMKPVH